MQKHMAFDKHITLKRIIEVKKILRNKKKNYRISWYNITKVNFCDEIVTYASDLAPKYYICEVDNRRKRQG